jgi:hypothetical protein
MACACVGCDDIDAHAIWHASSATGAPAIASATTSEKSRFTID